MTDKVQKSSSENLSLTPFRLEDDQLYFGGLKIDSLNSLKPLFLKLHSRQWHLLRTLNPQLYQEAICYRKQVPYLVNRVCRQYVCLENFSVYMMKKAFLTWFGVVQPSGDLLKTNKCSIVFRARYYYSPGYEDLTELFDSKPINFSFGEAFTGDLGDSFLMTSSSEEYSSESDEEYSDEEYDATPPPSPLLSPPGFSTPPPRFSSPPSPPRFSSPPSPPRFSSPPSPPRFSSPPPSPLLSPPGFSPRFSSSSRRFPSHLLSHHIYSVHATMKINGISFPLNFELDNQEFRPELLESESLDQDDLDEIGLPSIESLTFHQVLPKEEEEETDRKDPSFLDLISIMEVYILERLIERFLLDPAGSNKKAEMIYSLLVDDEMFYILDDYFPDEKIKLLVEEIDRYGTLFPKSLRANLNTYLAQRYLQGLSLN